MVSGALEDIVAKDDLQDDEIVKIVISRMLRRIDVYADLLGDERGDSMTFLRKSLTEQLSPEEKDDLESLQFERSAAILATETGELDELDRLVGRYKSLLQEFRTSSVCRHFLA